MIPAGINRKDVKGLPKYKLDSARLFKVEDRLLDEVNAGHFSKERMDAVLEL